MLFYPPKITFTSLPTAKLPPPRTPKSKSLTLPNRSFSENFKMEVGTCHVGLVSKTDSDTDMKIILQGAKAVLRAFPYLFSCFLGKITLE